MDTELEQLRSKALGGDGTYFLVTTGGGRQKVAHRPVEQGSTTVLCNKSKDGRLRRVDSLTVDKFYSKCCDCERLNHDR